MRIEVKYEGLRAIEENLRFLREQFGVRTGGIIIRGLRVGAKIIRDEARRRAPKQIPSGWVPYIDFNAPREKGQRGRRRKFKSWDGLLRSSIVEHAIGGGSRPWGKNPRWGAPTVVVRVRNSGYTKVGGKLRFNRPGSSAGWWWWVEFGTSKYPAQPFMRPAFESKKHEALEAAIAHIRKEIDEFFKQNLKKAA